LASRHAIALLYLQQQHDPPLDDGLARMCAMVYGVPHTPSAGKLELARAAFRDCPFWVTALADRTFAAAVRDTIGAWQPDLVQFEYHVMGQYLPALSGYAGPRVLRQHEPGAFTARERDRKRRGLARLAGVLDRRAWPRYERRVMESVDAVVALTDRDADALRRLAPGASIACIPLGLRVPDAPLSAEGRDPPSLLFIGSFVHPPNADAAERLVKRIFPIIRREVGDAVLRIIGADPPPALVASAGPGIDITGQVPDVTPFLDAAAVVLAPIRLGGGMRVKVMEALAAGKAVVASRRAVEGMALASDEQVVLADTDEEVAAAAIALLTDRGRRARIAASARQWAAANLGIERPVAAFERLYASLVR